MVFLDALAGPNHPRNHARRIVVATLLIGLLILSECIYFSTRPPLDVLVSHFTFGMINRFSKVARVFNFSPSFLKRNYVQIKYRTDKFNECPAPEVYRTFDTQGRYGYSTTPRVPRPQSVRFRVGQIVKHQKYGYRGVVIGYDANCKATDMWRIAMHQQNAERAQNTPHYAVLVDTRNRPQEQQTYVAEWNLKPDFSEVRHSRVGDFFDRFDKNTNRYVMRPALKQIYLED